MAIKLEPTAWLVTEIQRPKAWIPEYLLRTQLCAGFKREVDGAVDGIQIVWERKTTYMGIH